MDFVTGVISEQIGITLGQRGWKRQPGGGFNGEGISPLNIIGLDPASASSGSVNWEADISALV